VTNQSVGIVGIVQSKAKQGKRKQKKVKESAKAGNYNL
jgi:hypothetical protein